MNRHHAVLNRLLIIFVKNFSVMSLLNQQNNKDKKKANKKANAALNKQGSKFIQKPKSTGFVSKQANTGSQRGS
jgi:hypothetical protein